MYLPFTPPLNSEYSVPSFASDLERNNVSNVQCTHLAEHTFAAACVQAGILFSSVSRLNKSSAAAMKFDSKVMVVVLMPFLASVFLTAGTDAVTGAGTGVDAPEVPAEVGCPLTVRSFPCVSIKATGNLEKIASKTAGSCFFANVYSACASEEDWPDIDHSY